MTQTSHVLEADLPHWWRITRYDPRFRDQRGAYIGRTWTAISDVGSIFDGQELTLDQYLAVEARYLDAAVAFATETGVSALQVRNYDVGDGVNLDLTDDEGAVVALEPARELVRQMLREERSHKLESLDNRFVIHVGSDLYMFIGSAVPCEAAVNLARHSGLFVDEHFVSPFADPSY